MHPLVPVVELLKTLGSSEKFGRIWGLNFKGDLTEKSVDFRTLATCNVRFLLFLVKWINKRNWLDQ